MATDAEKRVPPYLPFKTFLSSLDALAHGVPPRIDRTLWRSQSGVTQGLIMSAYRFFGLVDDSPGANDSSTDYLDQIARTPDKRPEVLRDLLAAQYADILDEHDLSNMTMRMLEEAFEKHFSVGGGTKQKAITFFLKCAKFAQMPLSPYLTSQIRATRKKRSQRPHAQENGNELAVSAPIQIPNQALTVHTVRLASGGTLNITIAANPFKMPQKDRDFVFSLIDKLQAYENEQRSAEESEEEEVDEEQSAP